MKDKQQITYQGPFQLVPILNRGAKHPKASYDVRWEFDPRKLKHIDVVVEPGNVTSIGRVYNVPLYGQRQYRPCQDRLCWSHVEPLIFKRLQTKRTMELDLKNNWIIITKTEKAKQ